MSEQPTQLDLACQHLGVDIATVVKSREEDGEMIVLADLGIKGTKKFRVPLTTLSDMATEAAAAKPKKPVKPPTGDPVKPPTGGSKES